MRDFRKLKVWECAHELLLKVYKVSAAFSKEERYGLTNQLRRAALSVPTNIAEGCAAETEKHFREFIRIAMGSALETEYLLLAAKDIGILPETDEKELLNRVVQVKKMLTGFRKSILINTETQKGSPFQSDN